MTIYSKLYDYVSDDIIEIIRNSVVEKWKGQAQNAFEKWVERKVENGLIPGLKFVSDSDLNGYSEHCNEQIIEQWRENCDFSVEDLEDCLNLSESDSELLDKTTLEMLLNGIKK